MPPRRSIELTAVALLALGGRGQGASPRVPILGGEPAGDDRAVIALVRGAHTYCSAVLIAPAVAVTAAHCVVDRGAIVVPDGVTDAIQPDAGSPITAVAWVELHPALDLTVFHADLALLGLAAPLAAAPLPYRAADDVVPGADLRLVGYGYLRPDGGSGTRRTAVARAIAAGAREVLHAPLSCHGDSGGAVLHGEQLVAVVSNGTDDCRGSQPAIATRVAAHAAWLDARAAVAGAGCAIDGRCAAGCADDPDCACVADGACACPSDPDCGRAEVGAACAIASCTTGAVCVALDAGARCVARCAGDELCGFGLVCAEVDGDPLCVPGPAQAPAPGGC